MKYYKLLHCENIGKLKGCQKASWVEHIGSGLPVKCPICKLSRKPKYSHDDGCHGEIYKETTFSEWDFFVIYGIHAKEFIQKVAKIREEYKIKQLVNSN